MLKKNSKRIVLFLWFSGSYPLRWGGEAEPHVCLDGEAPGTCVEQTVPDSRARLLRVQSSAFEIITCLWTSISRLGERPFILE